MPRLREADADLLARYEKWAGLLREARVSAEMSLWALHKASGVAAGSLHDFENRRRPVPVWAQMRLCGALGLPVAAVFPRDDLELATAELHRKRRLKDPGHDDKVAAELGRVEDTDNRLRREAS